MWWGIIGCGRALVGCGGALVGCGGALVGCGGALVGCGGALVGCGGALVGCGGALVGCGGALVGCGGALVGCGGVAVHPSTVGKGNISQIHLLPPLLKLEHFLFIPLSQKKLKAVVPSTWCLSREVRYLPGVCHGK